MRPPGRSSAVMVWAARELMRHLPPTLLLWAGLSATVTWVALILLHGRTMTHLCDVLLEQSPGVVVRRVDAGGWAPLPAQAAVAHAAGVPGVLRPRTRIWGVAWSPAGQPLTVVGWSPENVEAGLWPAGTPVPTHGQVVLGPALAALNAGEPFVVTGRVTLALALAGRLPAHSGAAAHDVAVVHREDARRLLGLADDQVSDLVLDVFREEEVAAVCDELALAFPWPVQITTRRDRHELCLGTAARRGGAALVGVTPALLAIFALVAATRYRGLRQRRFLGLLKALGWSSADILRLQAWGIGLIAGPASAAGLAAAYGLFFFPGPGAGLVAWFGWAGPALLPPPALTGLVTCFGTALLLVVVPFVSVGLWTARGAALVDPGDMLQL